MKDKKHSAVKKRNKTSIFIHLFFILFGVLCIVPFMIVVSASLSSETDLAINGFSVLPSICSKIRRL